VIGSRGFLFLVIGPHKPAPGPFDLRLRLGKYFRLRGGIGPRTPAPGICGYPSGGFSFLCVGRPFVGAGDVAGKMSALQIIQR
jgi:hypothetical protein